LGTLVTPDNPLPVVAYAAQELQYHIARATAVKLPIARESDRPRRRGHLPGRVPSHHCRWPAADDLFSQRVPHQAPRRGGLPVGDDSAGEVLGFLVHNWTRVGTLFAVYHLLEQELGCAGCGRASSARSSAAHEPDPAQMG